MYLGFTENVPRIVALIERIINNGHAYVVRNVDVYLLILTSGPLEIATVHLRVPLNLVVSQVTQTNVTCQVFAVEEFQTTGTLLGVSLGQRTTRLPH